MPPRAPVALHPTIVIQSGQIMPPTEGPWSGLLRDERPMQRIVIHGVNAAAALLVACAMLLVNYAFEAAGSVPDFPACGFMAGSIWALLALYPSVAGAVMCYVAVPILRRQGAAPGVILRSALAASGAGALIYFGGAAILLGLQGRLGAAPARAWCIAALCIPLTAVGGAAGALLARERPTPPDLQGQEG